jgi:threonine dehydrogenase-like Zn-dependent dehydrogenase
VARSGVAVKNGPGSNAKLGQLYVCLGMNPCFECKQCKLGRENMCRKGEGCIFARLRPLRLGQTG